MASAPSFEKAWLPVNAIECERESLIRAQEMQSGFSRHAQRNAFRRSDARQQIRTAFLGFTDPQSRLANLQCFPANCPTLIIRLVGLGLSVSLFMASLGFKTLILSKGDSSFLLGWVCLLFGFSDLPWFANPLFMLGIIFLLVKKFPLALAASAASAILATTTLFIREEAYNEAGHTASVIGYGPGFYLWLTSIFILLITSVLATFLERKTQQPPPLPHESAKDYAG